MAEINHPPLASALIESTRSIGYSFDSAIADIIDNSVAAKSKNINIQFRVDNDPHVAIIDDGFGMTKETLIQAMRFGSNDSTQDRAENDLGRYGLGLKTASISQCKCLTVISLANNEIAACRWDIELVKERQDWILQVLEIEEINSIPYVDILYKKGNGTIVFWQNLDRIVAGENSIQTALKNKMEQLSFHLGLIFHRYIQGEIGLIKMKISINNVEVESIDPFLSTNSATQRLPEDTFTLEGKIITVKPFILPHISKLNKEELTTLGGREKLKDHQGFYIYRRCRLIIWGTWFKLASKDELSQLARVRIDIPNSLDHLWTLDVKKSTAYPPLGVRQNLKRTINKIKEKSGRTLVFRGRINRQGEIIHLWNEVADRDGTRFEINLRHPFIETLYKDLQPKDKKLLSITLKAIENAIPIEGITKILNIHTDNVFNNSDLLDMLNPYLVLLQNNKMSKAEFTKWIITIEPFNKNIEAITKIIKDLK